MHKFSNQLSNILWGYVSRDFYCCLKPIFICSASALSIIHSPSTISRESASVKPCSFFSLILISPVSFLWHLLRSNRLWLADFSILVLLSSWSSSPSLNHWIFMGLCPRKCNLKMALCPTLTVFGSVKALRSSRSNLGGSKELEKYYVIRDLLQHFFISMSVHFPFKVCKMSCFNEQFSNLWHLSLPLFYGHLPQNGIFQSALPCTCLWPIYELAHL